MREDFRLREDFSKGFEERDDFRVRMDFAKEFEELGRMFELGRISQKDSKS